MEDHIKSIAVPVPEWLTEIQEDAKRRGLDKLTMLEIDAEIAASRRDRRSRQKPNIGE